MTFIYSSDKLNLKEKLKLLRKPDVSESVCHSVHWREQVNHRRVWNHTVILLHRKAGKSRDERRIR